MKKLLITIAALAAWAVNAADMSFPLVPGTANITAGTISGIGGDTMTGDQAARSSVLRGSNAWPQAATNITGGHLCLSGGAGQRLYTVVDYTALAGKTATITVTPATGTSAATVRTEGVNWTAATSNTVTATSLASTINAISGVRATSSGAVVYITPAATTCAVTISTNAGAPMTATSGTDGTLSVVGNSSIKSSSPTAGIGYDTGAGGTVTQATSKATGFTLNKATSEITMAGDILLASTAVSSTWTNSAIAVNDVVSCSHKSGGTLGAYVINVASGAGTATLTLRNISLGSLTETPVLQCNISKGAVS